MSYVGASVQDYLIPAVDPPRALQLSVLGADGGDSATDGCRQPGGAGATAEAQFSVGTGTGQLAPGGTIRFIIGERGENGWRNHGGGGGGGSAVLYRSPDNTGNSCDDWTILVAAGAGGGANVKQIFYCYAKSPGEHAEVGTCGSDGKDNNYANRDGGEGGCGGTNGGTGEAGSRGGKGALSSCPNGSEGQGSSNNPVRGGWGFGGGGWARSGDLNTFSAGAGGGGYSGGGGGGAGRGGGGGGSYVADIANRGEVTEGSPNHTDGFAWYQCLDLPDTCDTAFSLARTINGMPVPLWFATASGASASCRTADGPDLFYTYTARCREAILFFVTADGPTTVSVTDGCDGQEVGCNFGVGTQQFVVPWYADPGVEYTIRVANDAGFAGQPSLRGITEPQTPLNDLPENAIEFDETDLLLKGSTCASFPDISGGCDLPWALDGDVWYKVTAPGPCVSTLTLSGWSDQFAVSVHTDDLTELVCSTDGSLAVEIPSGETYYVRVAGEALPQEGDGYFELGVSLETVSPENASPRNAAELLPGDVLAGNMCAAPFGDYEVACALADGAVWYTYTNLTQSCETIELVWTNDGVTSVSAHDPVTFEQLDGQCSVNGALTTSIAAGDTLIVRLGAEPNTAYSVLTGVSSSDTDGDGITDACDQCPGEDDLADCDGNLIGDCTELAHPGRFEDFSGRGQMAYTINANSQTDPIIANGVLRLTQDQPMEMASVVFEPVTDNPTGKFAAEFDFRIGQGSGAEGMSFALLDADMHDETALFGETGPGAGSLTLALDTFIGDAQSGNHARLLLDGTEIAIAEVALPLDVNLWLHAEVQLDGAGFTLILTPEIGVPEVVFSDVAVPGFQPFRARYGFGARTGDLTNKHRVSNVRFTDLSNTNDDDGDGIINPCDESCYADFNGDETVNTLDVLAFLNAWNASDTAADCNEDGSINTLDVLCFLNLWNAGC